MSDEINVMALVKGRERYIFLYDDAHKAQTLRTLGRFACNTELSFSWYDAAVLGQRVRSEAREQLAREAEESDPFEMRTPVDFDDIL